MRQWRLIYDKPARGAWNMAVDEAILRAVGQRNSPPTLRFYAWSIPCLSIGYGQRAQDVDFSRIEERGWDSVRRPTGGRAILHTDELTYSLALPHTHPIVDGDVVTSYRRISDALLIGLEGLGIAPRANRLARRPTSNPAICFELASHYEVTFGGRKLIGSAQVRRHGAVLQHGTLPLSGDLARICGVLVYEDERDRRKAQANVTTVATTLYDAIGRNVDRRDAANALKAGVEECFDVRFAASQSLTEAEQIDATQFMQYVYTTEQWTRRR